jgi:TolB-like protein
LLLGTLAVLAARSYKSRASESQAGSSAGKASVETMAVLPFRDISAATTDSWGIGITDAIISRLASLQNLAVRPTTSVLKYTKDTPDPVEAAKSLNVQSVLEGTYQRSADVIRVTVQLIDGATGNTKWSQRYDLHSADVLSFEDQIATKVVEGLQIQVTPTEQKAIETPATTSVEAYNDYLQARYQLTQYFVDSKLETIEEGKRLLLHALSLDKNFADAYGLLALFYGYQGANFVIDASANVKRCETAALNALRIDSQSVVGLTALGGCYSEQGRGAEAIRTMRQAVTLAPNNSVAWEMLGYSYYYAGLNEAAEQAYRHNIELDPTPPHNHWMHARMLLCSGKAHEAELEMRDVVARNPDQAKAVAHFGMILYYEGKLDEAESNVDRAALLARNFTDDTPRLLAAFVYAARHERAKIDPKILRYRPEDVIDGDQAYWTGGIHALLGDRQQALEWLKRTVALGDVNYPWFERDKNYDSLRSDPEYQSIMSEVRQRWQAYKTEFDVH